MTTRLNIVYKTSGSSALKAQYVKGYKHYIKHYGKLFKEGKVFRYIGNREDVAIVRQEVKTKENKQQYHTDETMVLLLGGTFKEIGGTDETLGGGNQKVG